MTDFPVPCIRIDEARKDAYLDAGYNPLTEDLDWGEFLQERMHTIAELKERVAEVWTPGIGEGDFFMHEAPARDRFLCIEVSHERMLDRRLLEIVHDVISRTEADYSVDVCDSWGYLRTSDGEDYPHFNVFVEKTRILIYSESDLLFKQLGIPIPGEAEEE